MTFSLIAERRRHGPRGAEGGAPGGARARPARRPSRCLARRPGALRAGQRLRVETPGGGGFGDAPNLSSPVRERDRLPRPRDHGLADGRPTSCGAGFPLSVWTHTPGKAERWAAEHGATARATPAEVAGDSDIVISMVVDGEQVASVLLGERWRDRGGPPRAPVRGHVDDRPLRHAPDRSGTGRARGANARCARDRLLAAGAGRHADDHGRAAPMRTSPARCPCSSRWAS